RPSNRIRKQLRLRNWSSPVQITQLWWVYNAQVGTASSDNGVNFVACCQVSSDHRENTCLVAYLVAEWCKESPAIGRFAVKSRLAYYNRDYITPMLFEHLSDYYCVVNFKAALDTVTGRDSNR